MKYRENRRTHDLISEIGLGSAYISEAGQKDGIKALQTAFRAGTVTNAVRSE